MKYTVMASAALLATSVFSQPAVISPVAFFGTGLNDATSGGFVTGAAGNYVFTITTHTTGTPDTFNWGDGAGGAVGVPMTGAAQLMAFGVTVKFATTTGHTIGDRWTITVTANGSLTTSTSIVPGAGAVFRSAQSKARDSVSILDFFPVGVTCDGSTDVTAYIQNALNSGPTVLSTAMGTCVTGPLFIPTGMTLNVVSGSTLLLKPSSSGDLLTINASGSLVTGRGTLDGNAANQSAAIAYPGMGVVRVAADDVTVSGGLTVQNGYNYGIWCWVELSENQNIDFNRRNISITGISVIQPVSSQNAIAISGNLAYSKISDNQLTSPHDGIEIFLPHDNVFAGNLVHTGRIGIELFAGSTCNMGGVNGCTGLEPLGYNNTVSGNSIYVDPATFTGAGDFAMGISLSGQTGCSSHGNVIALNPSYSGTNAYAGHEIASGNPVNGGSNNNTISGGSVTGAFPASIVIDTSYSNTVTGVAVTNTFLPASGTGNLYGAVRMLGGNNGGQANQGNVISGLEITVSGLQPCYTLQPLGASGTNNNLYTGGSCTGDGTSGGMGVALQQFLSAMPPSPAVGNTVSHVIFGNLDIGIWRNPTSADSAPYVFGNSFASVNTPYGGQVSNVFFPGSGYSASPLDARQPTVVFTPTTIGWYRILNGSTAQSLGGAVRIMSPLYDNKVTDIELQYDIPSYIQTAFLNQVRYSAYNNGVVDQVRSSCDNSGNVYLDIHISSATTPQPITIEFIGGNIDSPTSMVLSPVVGATPGPDSVTILTLQGGFNTTGPVSGLSGQLSNLSGTGTRVVGADATGNLTTTSVPGITQLHQDVLAGPGPGNQAATVVGLETVPFCTGFTPTANQVITYTTASTPNPCYTATASSSFPTGAWATFTPTVSAIGATATVTASAGSFLQVGKTVFVRISATFTLSGAATLLQFGLPVNPITVTTQQVQTLAAGVFVSATSLATQSLFDTSGSRLLIASESSAFPATLQIIVNIGGVYEAN